MGKVIKEEDVEGIIGALNTYIQDVTEAKQRMRMSMAECEANLPQDIWSAQASQELRTALKKLDATIEQAQALIKKVKSKWKDIQSLHNRS